MQKYPEADLEDEALEDFGVGPGALYGEVKIPGNGFVACLIQDGKPYVFYDEDDGWGECPKNVEHVQI